MRIAFDAKRAYQNSTGLGNYSRLLIDSLARYFPQHEYYLAAPKETGAYTAPVNTHIIGPQGLNKLAPSLWRSRQVVKDLEKNGIALYHGLSNEIPLGIGRSGIKTVVTIHDLIFEYYPEQYKAADVQLYRKKFRYACSHADRVIAISAQTKEDIISRYGIDEAKVSIAYQCCNPAFEQVVSKDVRETIKKKYRLPEKYLLYVGSLIERKNLLNICKALCTIKDKLSIPLVVIGSGNGGYAAKVKAYVKAQQMEERVIFLEDRPEANDPGFHNSTDFPAIYQSAEMLLYPSTYEGFGLPVLEALWSKTPVITSNTSCLPETGGDAAYYIDPFSVDEIANAIVTVSSNDILRQQMILKGIAHAQKFTAAACAANVMDVYESLCS